jgi:hypothetical protein
MYIHEHIYICVYVHIYLDVYIHTNTCTISLVFSSLNCLIIPWVKKIEVSMLKNKVEKLTKELIYSCKMKEFKNGICTLFIQAAHSFSKCDPMFNSYRL